VAILIVVLQCPSIHVSGFSSPSFTRPHLHAHNNHHVTSINNIPIIISSSRHGSSLYSTIDGDSSSVKTSNTDLSENVSSSNMSTSTSTSNFLQAVEYDWNGVINASVLLIVSLVVLSKFSLVDQGMMRGWTAAEMAVRIPVDNWYVNASRHWFYMSGTHECLSLFCTVLYCIVLYCIMCVCLTGIPMNRCYMQHPSQPRQ